MRSAVAFISCAMVLALLNFSIVGKERQLESGKVVFLELAPVDPRSLMQGDYMALRFKIANDARPAMDRSESSAGRRFQGDLTTADGRIVAAPGPGFRRDVSSPGRRNAACPERSPASLPGARRPSQVRDQRFLFPGRHRQALRGSALRRIPGRAGRGTASHWTSRQGASAAVARGLAHFQRYAPERRALRMHRDVILYSFIGYRACPTSLKSCYKEGANRLKEASVKAAFFKEHGGAEKVLYDDYRDPRPGPDDVVVRVGACGLNHVDILLLDGRFPPPEGLPHVNGCEVTGTIETVGAAVRGLARGQRAIIFPRFACGGCGYCVRGERTVCVKYGYLGAHRDGGYAELVKAPAANILPLPDAISFEAGAALPLAMLTAWHALVAKAGLKPRQTGLGQAAGRGGGRAAIPNGRLVGAGII